MESEDPALADHLRSCLSCVISANAPYYEAPPDLEQRVRQKLRHETAAPPYWKWGAVAASLLLMASLAGNMALLRSRGAAQQPVASALISAHVRSLIGTHLLDVPSSDQHTVKPWFNGRLDFSPSVRLIDGFPLLGGRVEYIEGRPAAALIYGRARHVINLFIWPTTAASAESRMTFNGYHLQNWSDGGMTFWAVSDLNEAELAQFVLAYRQTKP
jgi:anti-sigma factor RsiW